MRNAGRNVSVAMSIGNIVNSSLPLVRMLGASVNESPRAQLRVCALAELEKN